MQYLFQNKVIKQVNNLPQNDATSPPEVADKSHAHQRQNRYSERQIILELLHTIKQNLPNRIYRYARENCLQSIMGLIHVVIHLCCKIGRVGLQNGKCANKLNRYMILKNMVGEYYYGRDLETSRISQCAQTTNTVSSNRGNLQYTTFTREM